MGETVTGGCLCGAVRYQVRLPVLNAGYCHCRMCQRAAGAPAVAWLTVPRTAFAFTRGDPAVFRSSPRGLRRFCGACGTPLTFEFPEDMPPDTPGLHDIDVTVASLDTPEAVPPDHHSWTSSRIGWFDTVDRLPRHTHDYPG